MPFTNLPIPEDELPQVQSVPLKPIHPDYLKALRITWLIIFFIILVDELQTMLAISIGVCSYLLLLTSTVMIGTRSFKRKKYAVRERDILYSTGWLFQHLHMVPFNRLQHCVVNMGPIDRRFGLASVSLYTAASEGKDITIHGLKLTEAEHLKDLIMQQIQPLQPHANTGS
jgi:uncharacterized protein